MGFYQGYAPGMPGLGNTVYSRGRMVWAGLAGVQYLPVGGIIASALSRDPDNFETNANMTEPGTPPTSSGVSNIASLPGAIGTSAPTSSAPGYSGVLRAGLLMGRITSTPTVALCGTTSTAVKGFYRPSILGVTGDTVGTGVGTITTSAQCAYEVQRLITLGITSFTLIGVDGSNVLQSVAVTSATSATVSGTTGTINATVAAFSNGPLTAGAFICPADGSQNPVTFVDDQFGLSLIDAGGNTIDGGNSSGNSWAIAPFPRVPLAGGLVNVLNIVNYPATTVTNAAKLQAFLKGNLNSGGGVGVVSAPVNYGGKFNFTDDYGL